jgi:hypothetical protein
MDITRGHGCGWDFQKKNEIPPSCPSFLRQKEVRIVAGLTPPAGTTSSSITSDQVGLGFHWELWVGIEVVVSNFRYTMFKV